MLDAVRHAAANSGTISHDWTFYITFISGVAVTWITLYFKVIRPRMKEHRSHEAERERQRQEEHDWIHGRPATLGSPAIISAPEKLKAVQDSQNEVVASVKMLTKRMDEANGTAKATRDDVKTILARLDTLGGQPPATVAEVKEAVTTHDDEIAARQSEILERLPKDKT
jgi:hypothetical protein